MNKFIANFTGFEGRIGRQTFWIGSIALAVVGIVIELLILPIFGLNLMPNVAAMVAAGGDAAAAEAANAAIAGVMRTSGWVGLIMLVIFIYPASALLIKRRHDRNNNGLDVWIYFGLSALVVLMQALGLSSSTTDIGNGVMMPVPSTIGLVLSVIVGIYAIYMLVVLGFLKGTAGPNDFGPDPLGS